MPMNEKAQSKFIWIVVGAMVGSSVSLFFDKVVRPYFASTPELRFSASSDEVGTAAFSIANDGNAAASDVAVTVWAMAPFSARTDIDSIEHAGGVSDVACSAGIYQARLMGPDKSAVPSAINTEAKAALVQCTKLIPGGKWRGRIKYTGTEAVFGLMAHIKESNRSLNLYGRFADSHE